MTKLLVAAAGGLVLFSLSAPVSAQTNGTATTRVRMARAMCTNRSLQPGI